MHLITIFIVAAMAVAFIPEAVSGECYDGAASAKLTTDRKWIEDSIARHNEYRVNHGACPLTYNQKLSEIAQAYANKLAARDRFEHSHTPCLGENLAQKGSTADFQIESKFAVDGWYEEIKDYDFKSGAATKRSAVIGHLTQVLWKESREVGIAYTKYKAPGGWTKVVVVAEYFPQGNINMATSAHLSVFPKCSPVPEECKDAAPAHCSAENWNRLQMLPVWIIVGTTVSLVFAS